MMNRKAAGPAMAILAVLGLITYGLARACDDGASARSAAPARTPAALLGQTTPPSP